MLLAAAILGYYIKCNEGFYVDSSNSFKQCIPLNECRSKYYPYTATGTCEPYTPDSSVTRNKDGSYSCRNNQYLLLASSQDNNNKTSSCIQQEEVESKCSNAYISERKKVCVESSYDCIQMLGQYTYEEDGTKRCLTAEECTSTGKFISYNYDSCLTAAQCKDKQAYAYSPAGDCLTIEPNTNGDFNSMTNDIYDCGNKYLDITGNEARCVSQKTCKELLYDSKHLCLTEEKCYYSYDNYLYINGSQKECVSAETCRKEKGRYAYDSTQKCDTIEPDLQNGNFNQRYDGDYVYSCVHDSYNEIYEMLYITDKAMCVSNNKCLYGQIAGIIIGDSDKPICISREDWLNQDPRNYVDDDLGGQTYSTAINQYTKASDLCQYLSGAILIEGRICGCPSGMYEDYGNSDQQSKYIYTCKQLPSTLDSLLVDISYTYNGKHIVQHMGMVTVDECLENGINVYEGFITPDYQYCVYECSGPYQFSGNSHICTCADGYTQQPTEKGFTCVQPTSCLEHQIIVNGQCTCTDGFIFSQDGKSCTCAAYLTDNGARCVNDCGPWYWKAENGRCTKESWRLVLAIVIPIVVLLAAGAGVFVFFFMRKKKHYESMAVRENLEMQ